MELIKLYCSWFCAKSVGTQWKRKYDLKSERININIYILHRRFGVQIN